VLNIDDELLINYVEGKTIRLRILKDRIGGIGTFLYGQVEGKTIRLRILKEPITASNGVAGDRLKARRSDCGY
jgi:hypothetical protein